MKLNVQKRLAGEVLGCSGARVCFDSERLGEIKEAITKVDIRKLVKEKAITKKPLKSASRAGARKNLEQKRAGRRRGQGSRKGKKNARESQKTEWINRARSQRKILKAMKDKELLSPSAYRSLYMKAKGGFFRNKNHLKLYIEERGIATKKEK